MNFLFEAIPVWSMWLCIVNNKLAFSLFFQFVVCINTTFNLFFLEVQFVYMQAQDNLG